MTVPRVTLEKPWAAGESTAVQEWERPGRGPAPFCPSGKKKSLAHSGEAWILDQGQEAWLPVPWATCLTV